MSNDTTPTPPCGRPRAHFPQTTRAATEPPAAPAWKARPEAGSTLALRLLIWAGTALNRRILRALLYPTVAYFYCTRAPERRASRAFLRRALDRPARESDVLRHFLEFARAAADRLYFMTGKTQALNVRFVGGEEVREVVDRGKPGIFLTAHFGSFEASRVIGPGLGGIDLRIVLDKGVNQRFIDLLAELNPDLAGRIIDANRSPSSLGVAIAASVREGDWVGIPADRHRPGDQTVPCDFLGTSAAFPVGPYLVASALKAPIICLFCHVDAGGYEVHCEVLTEACHVARRDRATGIPALAQRFATRLEAHVRRTPFAWFNFYDFWAAAK